MQIACAGRSADIGDVTYPQLVGPRWDKSPDEVLPFVVAVIGVRRVTGLGRGQHQVIKTQQFIETVPAHHLFPSE